jgi:acyl carrier protein
MDDIRIRLKRCFTTVFPNVPREDIESATPQSIAGWDSIAMVTLISVVEEDFGVTIAIDDISDLNSFESFQRYLTTTNGRRS